MKFLILTGSLYPRPGNNANLIGKLIPHIQAAGHEVRLFSAAFGENESDLPEECFLVPVHWATDQKRDWKRKLLYPAISKITDRNGKVYTLNSVSDLENAGYPDLIRRIFAECINCFKLDKDGNLTESTGNITKLRFPAGIRSIGEGVYKDCHLLDTIELSEDTVGIGKSAFENSKWLKSVIGAGSVEYIGAMAFSGCQSLETIGLSDKLCELGSRCFEHCSSLKEIKISDRLEKIPERAFFRCKSLKNMFIPDSVKEIETEAFAFCDGLTEVSVGKDTKISDKAFAFCDNVQIIIRR